MHLPMFINSVMSILIYMHMNWINGPQTESVETQDAIRDKQMVGSRFRQEYPEVDLDYYSIPKLLAHSL